jgi:hypothetical protein
VQPIAVLPSDIASSRDALVGAVVTRELRVGPSKTRFRKGQVLTTDDLPTLEQSTESVHVVQFDPGDVHENDAGSRLATMIRGQGVMQRDPVQSRVNMVATHKGLVRVDREALLAMNLRPEIGVFTAPDRLPVVAGKIVAGAKISPVAIHASVLEEIRRELAARSCPVIQVKPFLPLTAGVVVTEGLNEKIRDRFEQVVRHKIGWYGGTILRFDYVADETADVARAMRSLVDDGVEVLLTAGGHMMDPLDATQQSLAALGASIVRLGAPAHPGSMFWLGHLDDRDIPIVSLASCSMYSRSTVADLVLPWVMAGERVTSADIATIGYGGLLDRDMGWRFPQYDVESVNEPDEDE